MIHAWTVFANRYDRTGTVVRRTWGQWCDWISNLESTGTKDSTAIICGPCDASAFVSPGRDTEVGIRDRAALSYQTAIVLDLDHGDIDRTDFNLSGVDRLIHTSSNPPRHHAILPLSRRVGPCDLLALHWMCREITLHSVDPTDARWDQGYYVRPFRTHRHEVVRKHVGLKTIDQWPMRISNDGRHAYYKSRFKRVWDRVEGRSWGPVELAANHNKVPDPVLWLLYGDDEKAWRDYYGAVRTQTHPRRSAEHR